MTESQSTENDAVIDRAKAASIRIVNARSPREITEDDARACAEGFVALYRATRVIRPG
jgi:hypothetical protein